MTRSRTAIVRHIVLTLCGLALLIWGVSRIINIEIAVGDVVLRSQRGASHPLPSTVVGPPPAHRLRTPVEPAETPRNIILFIGDGMGIGQLSTASALLDDLDDGLTVERAPVIALIRTAAIDDLVTDSAASATAMATAFKVKRKAVSVLDDGRIPVTLLEAAGAAGMATGVITTSGLADATPGAFVAHVEHRDSYEIVLQQMLVSDTDLMIGGDWTRKRKARRNRAYMDLIADVDAVAADRLTVVRTADELAMAEPPLVALFPPRPGSRLAHGPPLEYSVRRALELLADHERGFVLIVESEETDGQAHNNDLRGYLAGLRELDRAVATALVYPGIRDDTLVLVTADHATGVPAIVRARHSEGRAIVRWASSEHVAHWVPVFAFGPGAELFSGVIDNTEVGRSIAELLRLDGFPAAAQAP